MLKTFQEFGRKWGRLRKDDYYNGNNIQMENDLSDSALIRRKRFEEVSCGKIIRKFAHQVRKP